MCAQILDTQTQNEIPSPTATALCELGQVCASVFPSIKRNYSYPPCKVFVRSRENLFKVPTKACRMECKSLNGSHFDGKDAEDDGDDGGGVGSGFVICIFCFWTDTHD